MAGFSLFFVLETKSAKRGENWIMNKVVLENRFKELFSDYRLLAIQLNGFSHKVFCDEGKSTAVIIWEWSTWTHADREVDGLDDLFKGFYHAPYQNNAVEYVYVKPGK